MRGHQPKIVPPCALAALTFVLYASPVAAQLVVPSGVQSAPLLTPTFYLDETTPSSIRMLWPADPAATGYKLQLATDATFAQPKQVSVQGSSTGGNLTYTFSGLAPATLYYFRGYSTNSLGSSAASETKQIYTSGSLPTPTPTPPPPPAWPPVLNQVSATTSTVTIGIQVVTGACTFAVTRANTTVLLTGFGCGCAKSGSWVYSGTMLGSTPVINYTFTGLGPAASYGIQVVPYSTCTQVAAAAGPAGSLTIQTAASDPGATLAAPTNVTAVKGTTSIQVSWAAVTGATSYNVVYTKTIGTGYLPGCTATTTTCSIPNLTPGTTYYVGVYAVGPSGQSSLSPLLTTGTSKTLY